MPPPKPKPRTELARASARASHWAFGTKNQTEEQHAAALKNLDYINTRLRKTGGQLTDRERGIGDQWLSKPRPQRPEWKRDIPAPTGSPDAADANARAQQRNITRGAMPTGGPGRHERERAVKVFKLKDPKVRNKAILAELHRAGYRPQSNDEANANLKEFLDKLETGQKAAFYQASKDPFNIKRNTQILGREEATHLYGLARKENPLADPMRPAVGHAEPDTWASDAYKGFSDVAHKHPVYGATMNALEAIPWWRKTVVPEAKRLAVGSMLGIPALAETAYSDMVTRKTHWALAGMVKQGGIEWGKLLERAGPADLFTLGQATVAAAKGDPGKAIDIVKEDVKEAGTQWKEHPLETTINVIPFANMVARGGGMAMIAARMARLNPGMSKLKIANAVRKESYVPGWAARHGIKGGIPERMFTGKFIDDGEVLTEFQAPAIHGWSRTPLGRAGQKFGQNLGKDVVIGGRRIKTGPLSQTARAANALKRQRGLNWERERVRALQMMKPVTEYIKTASIPKITKDRYLNMLAEHRTRLAETFYGPQGPNKLSNEEILQAFYDDLDALRSDGGLDIPTRKMAGIDKELDALDRGLDKLGAGIDVRVGTWANAQDVMRQAGRSEPEISTQLELMKGRARVWAKSQEGRDPQDWLDSPDGRNIAGFAHGEPDVPSAEEMAIAAQGGQPQTLFQHVFPDEPPTSPLRPSAEDQIRNRNRAVHVRALRAGKAKWNEMRPDGTLRERNVSEKQMSSGFANDVTNGPDGKPLFGVETAYEDLIPRWEEGYREAFPAATPAEIRQAMLDSAAFYEEKVFPYLGRVMNSREVQAWLASQKGASPERGLLDLTKVIERAMLHEPIGSRDIGLASQTMARIIYGERNIAEGAAAKLTDFSDVGHTTTATRTFVNHDPEAGIPYVSDRWEARARGQVDADFLETLYRRFDASLQEQGYISYGNWETLRRQASDKATAWKVAKEKTGAEVTMAQRDLERDRQLRGLEAAWEKKTGDKVIKTDMGTGLTAVQYEHTSDWGAGLIDYLNDVEYLGKTDWNAASGQALDWAGFQHYMGVHPENVDWALLRQERGASFEIAGTSGLSQKFPEIEQMDEQARTALTKYVADTVINTAAQASGAIPIRTTVGYGGWMTYVNPAVRSGVLAADRVFRSYVDNIRTLLDEDEVWGAEGGSKGEFTQLSVIAPELRDPAKLRAVWEALSAEHPEFAGFSPHPDGGFTSILVGEDGLPLPRSSAFQAAVNDTLIRLEREHGLSPTRGKWDALGLVRSTRERGAVDAYLGEQLGRPDAARSPALRGRRADARAPEEGLRVTAADRRAVESKVRDGLDIYRREGTAGLEAQARVSGRIDDPDALPETTRLKEGPLRQGAVERVNKKGEPTAHQLLLHQAHPGGGVRGAAQWLDTPGGRQLIYISDKANASTFGHELFGHAAHEMKREYPEMFAAVEKKIGKRYEDWGEAEHERFATQVERYLMRGKAPTPELQPVFDQMRKWMYEVYETIKALGRPMPKETRQLLDRYFGKDPLEFEPPAKIQRNKPMPPHTDVAGVEALVDNTQELLSRGLESLSNDPRRRTTIAGNMQWLEEQVLPYMDDFDPALKAKVDDTFEAFDEIRSGKSIHTPEEAARIKRYGDLVGARARELEKSENRLAAQPDFVKMRMAQDIIDALDDPDLDLEGLHAATSDLNDISYEWDQKTKFDDETQKLLSRQIADLERALKNPRNKEARDAAIVTMRELAAHNKQIFIDVFGEGMDAEELAALRDALDRRDNILARRLKDRGLVDEDSGLGDFVPHYSIFDVLQSKIRGAVKLPAAGRSRKTLTLNPRKEKGAFGGKGGNRLIRYQKGEVAVTPQALLSQYMRRMRFVETQNLRRELFDLGVPIPSNGRVPKGWYIINGTGKAVPERVKALRDMSDDQIDQMLAAGEDIDATISTEKGLTKTLQEYRDNFLQKTSTGRIPDDWDGDKLKMLPPEVVTHMVGKVFDSSPGNYFASTVGLASLMARFATIYAHVPGYLGANIAANAIMLGATKPGSLITGLREFGRVPGSLRASNPHLYEKITVETGDVMADAGLPDFYVKEQNWLEHAEQTATHFSGRWAQGLGNIADQPFRVASWVGEARREGFTNVEQWQKLLDDPELEGVRNRVSQRARENMIDFNKLSDGEKRMARFVFIWPFMRGAVKWPFWMLSEYPGRAAVMANLARAQDLAYGDEHESVLDRYNKLATTDERSMFDLFQLPLPGGKSVNLSSVVPVGPLVEKMDEAGKLAGGDLSVIGDVLNPAFRTGGKQIFGDGGFDPKAIAEVTVPFYSYYRALKEPRKRGAQVYNDRDSFWDYIRRREGRFTPEDVDYEKVKAAKVKEDKAADKRPSWEKNTEEDLATVDTVLAAAAAAGHPVPESYTAAVKKSVQAYHAIDKATSNYADELGINEDDMTEIQKIEATERVAWEYFPDSSKQWVKQRAAIEALPVDKRGTSLDQKGYRQWLREHIGQGYSQVMKAGRDEGVIKGGPTP